MPASSKRPRIGLLPRIFLALALVGLAPLAVVTVGLFEANVDGMRDQVKRTHIVAVRATAARLEAYLSSRADLGDSLARNELLIRDPRGESTLSLLATTVQSQPNLAAIVVLDAQGETAVRVQRPDLAAIVDRVLAEGTQAGVSLVEEDGGLWLGFVTSLPDEVGTVHLVEDGAPLEGDIFHPEELGEDAELALVDADGRRLLGRFDPDTLSEEVLEWVLSQQVFGTKIFEPEGGEDFVSAVFPLQGAPWTVVSAQPGRVAERNAAQLRRRALIALGLASALAGLVFFVSYRTVVLPLRGILAAQARLEGLEVGPGNEISQLRESFARLAERVRSKQELGRVFLGRYQVLELIGEGGMGAVFRGWDPKLQRLVALKTIRPDSRPDDLDTDQASSLLREAILGARFNHGHVVSIYDVEDTEGAAYIAMEFVDGDSLDDYRKHRIRVPPEEAVPIAAAVARALERAHSLDILHRDIKPGNVLLGFDHSIKVTDFGIASFMSSLESDDDQKVFGTPGYIAPEVILGHPYRYQSDLFSLGVLLFEILAGKRPITGRDVRQLLVRTLQVNAAQVGQMLPPVPVELQRIVVRLLRREPEDRYASATEVAEALEELARQNAWRWSFDPIDADRDSGETVNLEKASEAITRQPTRRSLL